MHIGSRYGMRLLAAVGARELVIPVERRRAVRVVRHLLARVSGMKSRVRLST